MRKNQLQKAVLMVLAGSLIVGGAQAADDVVVDSNNNFIAGVMQLSVIIRRIQS